MVRYPAAETCFPPLTQGGLCDQYEGLAVWCSKSRVKQLYLQDLGAAFGRIRKKHASALIWTTICTMRAVAPCAQITLTWRKVELAGAERNAGVHHSA